MRRSSSTLLLLCAAALVLAAGCGGGDGGGDASGDTIAVVGDEEISKQQFEALMNQAERSYKAQRRPFPKPGSREYDTIKSQAVSYLVQRAQFEQKAADLDIDVSDEDVDKRLAQIKKQYFNGSEQRYQAQIKRAGLTEEQVRRDVRAQLIQDKIFKEVTQDVKVGDADIQAFYRKNKSQFTQAESREVRHILIAVCGSGFASKKDCLSDAKAKALARDIHARLQGGGNFAQLAKRYSDDPTTKQMGGKLTITRGQTVPPFDQTAFLLGVGTLSQPVKTQYGYHLIEPLSAVKKARTTPLPQVREQIRQQLLQEKRNEAMSKWMQDMRKEFCDGELDFQAGFTPKPDPCAATKQAGKGTKQSTTTMEPSG